MNAVGDGPNDQSKIVGTVIGLAAAAASGKVLGAGAGSGATRSLTAADLGLAEGTIVEGTFAVRAGKATAYVRYLGKSPSGLGRGLLEARNALRNIARAEGATVLRIETSGIIEETGRLLEILKKSHFAIRPNGTMWWEGALR